MGVRTGFIAAFVLFAVGAAYACPFCPTPDPPLAEQLTQADVALLVQWISAEQANKEQGTASSTTLSVVNIVRQPAADYKQGSTITLDRYRVGKPGDLFLLMGTKVDGIEWGNPLEVTETSFKYIIDAPAREVPAAKRLPYYVKYLEHPDELISKDAFSEFAAAPYRDIEPLAEQFSSSQLKEWISKKETNQTRIGFYGMMLGLAGRKEDAEFLKSEINKPTEAYRLGLDGLMAGYVMLLGDEGLPLLEEKLSAQGGSITPTYAAMQTLRFLWEYECNRVEKDRLRRSMRLLLPRDDVGDLAVKDLARWEDWELLPTLLELYDRPGQSDTRLKRSVIHFLLVLSKKRAGTGDERLAQQVAEAKAQLETLRGRDPKLVKDAERNTYW